MGFGEMAASRRKSKELKNELKQLRKDMIVSGIEKSKAESETKELRECIELGGNLSDDYGKATEHLEMARKAIVQVLEDMNENPVDQMKERFQVLIHDLDLIYDDCSIRKDDMDFLSTMTCLKKMTQEFDGNNTIMLRSELENLKAMLDDAAKWQTPDFLALAYYYLHEEKDTIRDMENGQRNAMVKHYIEEHFLNEFLKELEQTGLSEQFSGIIQRYI